MAAPMKEDDFSVIGPFNAKGTPEMIATSWKRYVRRFELYLFAKGVKTVSNQVSRLLYHGGDDVIAAYDLTTNKTPMEIAELETAPAPEDGQQPVHIPTWKEIIDSLNKHFEPAKSRRAAIRTFRSTSMLQDESLDQFVSRLKSLSVGCEFGSVHCMSRCGCLRKHLLFIISGCDGYF